MRYAFASLGKLESLGVRLGEAGLGNILFPWDTALIFAKNNNLQIIQPTWKNLKIGTFLRKERDKRMYMDLFTFSAGISGFKKFWLLIEGKIDYDDPLPISVIQLLNND